jgi:hypothetical protein
LLVPTIMRTYFLHLPTIEIEAIWVYETCHLHTRLHGLVTQKATVCNGQSSCLSENTCVFTYSPLSCVVICMAPASPTPFHQPDESLGVTTTTTVNTSHVPVMWDTCMTFTRYCTVCLTDRLIFIRTNQAFISSVGLLPSRFLMCMLHAHLFHRPHCLRHG